MRTSLETDSWKLKITLVTMTYHSQHPQCPSLSPHVLLLSLFVIALQSSSFVFVLVAYCFEVLVIIVKQLLVYPTDELRLGDVTETNRTQAPKQQTAGN